MIYGFLHQPESGGPLRDPLQTTLPPHAYPRRLLSDPRHQLHINVSQGRWLVTGYQTFCICGTEICVIKRPARQHLPEDSHASQQERNILARPLEPVEPNDVHGKALPTEGRGRNTVRNVQHRNETKRTLVGTSERMAQGSIDLSLIGPGETIRPRKRNRNGSFKVSPSGPKHPTERFGSIISSDGRIAAQLVCETDQESEGTEVFLHQAGIEARGATTSIKASAVAKSIHNSFRRKHTLKYAQATRRQNPKHRSQSASSPDKVIPLHRTLVAPNRVYCASQSTSSLLRLREMGQGGKSSWPDVDGALSQLRSLKFNSLKPWRTWTGASNDVMVLAWSPDGQSYAAGASAQIDESSMMYNRPNNLLYGSLPKDTIWEVPDHRIDRPLPATGPNSNQATYDACDPDLYMSVTSVLFSASGRHMYSASYDETVKVWDISTEGRLLCSDTLVHDAQVEVMALSGHDNDHLATGSRLVNDAIRVYNLSDNGSVSSHSTLSSSKAQNTPAREIYPSCLQWGLSPFSRHLLLAGFSESKDRDDSHDPGKMGDLCLWDLEKGKLMEVIPRAQNVFDVAWHPTLPVFAVGTVLRVGHISDKTCRTAVRIYEPFRMAGSTFEFECPALDINDVSFCPTDSHYITAGCTNGVTYVWDYRMPDTVVHQLEHGLPIAPMKPDMTREQSDTGIRLTAWADSGSQFYTGSSDGVVKTWDIKLAPEDVHIRDVAQFDAGVMCGAFSPDSTNLLVGDARGSVHILSTAPVKPFDNDLDEVKPIRYQRARDRDGDSEEFDAATQDNNDPSAKAARALIASNEIVMHPLWGAGQGPNYKGPYASYARAEGADPRIEPLLPQYQAQQLDPGQRALAARAGFWAEPAEQTLIAVQQELARARNLPVAQEDISPTKFPIRLSPEKPSQRTLEKHSKRTSQHQSEKQRHSKPASQLSTTSTIHQSLQSTVLLQHNKTGQVQQKATGWLSRIRTVMRVNEKHNATEEKPISISSDDSSDGD